MAAGLLHIIAPGISGPLADVSSLKDKVTLQRWVKVLSRARRQESATSMHALLVELFALSCDSDFPSAALSALAQTKYDGSLFYLCADPVHLQADMDHALLTSSADLSITEQQADRLCAALNTHFQQDGMHFSQLDKDRWLLACSAQEERDITSILTTCLSDAVGRNINFILPQGEAASYWKQVLTEAQMLLHAHTVNDQRENSGQSSINSLWFHGAGDLPQTGQHRIASICSDDLMMQGLASHVRCDHFALPESVEAYADLLLQQGSDERVLHLPMLEHLVNYSDVDVWCEGLQKLLDNWIYPLQNMANRLNIQVRLYPCNGSQYCFSRLDALRLWRRQHLAKHISSY